MFWICRICLSFGWTFVGTLATLRGFLRAFLLVRACACVCVCLCVWEFVWNIVCLSASVSNPKELMLWICRYKYTSWQIYGVCVCVCVCACVCGCAFAEQAGFFDQWCHFCALMSDEKVWTVSCVIPIANWALRKKSGLEMMSDSLKRVQKTSKTGCLIGLVGAQIGTRRDKLQV